MPYGAALVARALISSASTQAAPTRVVTVPSTVSAPFVAIAPETTEVAAPTATATDPTDTPDETSDDDNVTADTTPDDAAADAENLPAEFGFEL